MGQGPETLYLQIWHGSPLKTVHWDILWSPARLARPAQRDVDRWDVLVSPNAASTPRLRQAFRWDREVLEIGYPRNDVLNAPDRDERRARVRAQLGIPDGTTAVLYTPTFRDDAVFAGRSFELALDSDAFTAALGADHVLLLRLHYMITGDLPPVGDPGSATSPHPDVSELYLAADVLVTDYSSTMFDFAVTGRPLRVPGLRPRRLPASPARLLLRPRGRGARAAGRDDRGADRRPARPRGDASALRRRATRASASATATSRTATRPTACSSACADRRIRGLLIQ